ncbi:hypothetical protein [Dokdonella sp.]|uniref:hypothetical protein n=1 Tax=Dokdonella sp. TaxID=2291710 RepID=UPI002F42F54B
MHSPLRVGDWRVDPLRGEIEPDGRSERRSDATHRVAARRLHGGDGHVAWTQSCDRPLGDVVASQKDLAGEISRSLPARLAPAATHDAR